mgnify:CR=1 FL=1
MSSNYTPKSRLSRIAPAFEWSSDSVDFRTIVEDYKNPLTAEKERIEAIPLEQLEFTDLYEFPFHTSKYGGWVYDAKDNFIFQFVFGGEKLRNKVIQILNGELEEYNRREVKHESGYIKVKVEDEWHDFILIRGWGMMTGIGGYNLDGEYAGKIQNTLAEYIVEKLNT